MAFANRSTGQIHFTDTQSHDSSQCYYRGRAIDCLDDLPFFHGDISRNASEVLLLSNSEAGTYLLRRSSSNPGQYSISVRCKDSVKHYTLQYKEQQQCYVFGRATFESLQDVVDHFQCAPVLTSTDGNAVSMLHPYTNDVPEPHNYEDIATHAEQGKPLTEDSFPDLHIASKEGFMTKRGAIRKNWKVRWFVLNKNMLKYYKNRDSGRPIRTFDLRTAIEVCECAMDGKENCFKIVFPSRTFYMCSESAHDADQWMKILLWKVQYYLKIAANIRT